MQISHEDLAGNVTGETGGAMLDASSMDRFQSLGEAAMSMVNSEISRQAAMVAYASDFYAMMWMALLSLPLLLFLKKPEQRR